MIIAMFSLDFNPRVVPRDHIFVINFFSYHPRMLIFYVFWGLVFKKVPGIAWTGQFSALSFIIKWKCWFFGFPSIFFFEEPIPKNTYVKQRRMRMILEKCPSLGTSLGSPGVRDQDLRRDTFKYCDASQTVIFKIISAAKSKSCDLGQWPSAIRAPLWIWNI